MDAMLEKLKNYPPAGLAIAIAGGLVLAHFANLWVDSLYDEQPDMLKTLAIAAIVISLLVWQRARVFSWARTHWKGLTLTTAAVLVIWGVLVGIVISRQPETNRRYAGGTGDSTLDWNSAVPVDLGESPVAYALRQKTSDVRPSPHPRR